MILADLGCDIVRIVRPQDAGREAEGGGTVLNRNRGHLPLDFKAAADRQVALDLIARADALIEGYRPGVMERLGLGPEPWLSINPRLVFTRMTGWGQTGPLAPRAGNDINYIALTGALHAIGFPDHPSPPPLNYIGDNGGGAMFAVLAILAGVIQTRASGQGQVVDVAMVDGAATLSSLFHAFTASGHWSAHRGTNILDGSRPFYRCYRCLDGREVAVGALEPQFLRPVARGVRVGGRRLRSGRARRLDRDAPQFRGPFPQPHPR